MMKTMIAETFNINVDPDELVENKEIYSGCDKLFETENLTIGLKGIPGDFGPEELADVVETAEALWKALGKKVYLCLAMDEMNRVTVKEMSIKSEADFTIRLAIVDMYRIALEKIRNNIKNGTADDADRQVLETMPITVPSYRRKAIREECFRLLSTF